MALGNDSFNIDRLVVEINADDLVMRHHDVVNRNFLEVENADQHLLVATGDARARFVHDGAQFFTCQSL